VAAGQEADEDLADDIVLPDDDGPDLPAEGLEVLAELLRLLFDAHRVTS
jgi:hypothetical protein